MLDDEDVASQVWDILASASSNDELELQQAAELARVDTPDILRKLTPRFEAYFAIATLVRSLAMREEQGTIERRRQHAIDLVQVWKSGAEHS